MSRATLRSWALFVAPFVVASCAFGPLPPPSPAADASSDHGTEPLPTDCNPPSMLCDGVCTDVANDTNNCGGCGVACDQPANARVTCNDGACQYGCLRGYSSCGAARGAQDGCRAVGVDEACGDCTATRACATETGFVCLATANTNSFQCCHAVSSCGAECGGAASGACALSGDGRPMCCMP